MLAHLVAATLSSVASDSLITGTVAASESRWDGDAIVTRLEIRDDQGRSTFVVQLGGTVDGIGMVYSHLPSVLRPGDEVTVEVASSRTAAGTAALVVVGSVAYSASETGGTAVYGVQRTHRGNTPLWRASACIELTYDAASVTSETAAVLDAAFETWALATRTCGGPRFSSTLEPRASASTSDERNTVQIRAERWCRPASGTIPEVCYPRTASAMTRLKFVDDPAHSSDGQILDADVELNAVDFVLLAPGEIAPAGGSRIGVDLLGVATHEAGHVLGLAHNCGIGGEAWPTDHAGNAVPSCDQPAGSPVALATMFFQIAPGETHERTVEAGDSTGACSIDHGEACERFIVGGCSTSRGSASTLGLWLILVVGRRKAARRRPVP